MKKMLLCKNTIDFDKTKEFFIRAKAL